MNPWWHRFVLRHPLRTRQVSIPMWDTGSKGFLITCECGKVWAL